MSEERNDVIKYVRGVSRGPIFEVKQLCAPQLESLSLALFAGETLAVIGESGGGKSTLARRLAGYDWGADGDQSVSGELRFNGAALPLGSPCAGIQLACQDISRALNPRKTAWQAVADPLRATMSATARQAAAGELLRELGMAPADFDRKLPQLRPQQRQLIVLARALVNKPQVLIWDGAASALDPAVQAQVLNALVARQQQDKLSIIFISHDLAAVHHICDRVMVMYRGKVVEYGSRQDIFYHPQHPYTKALIGKSSPGNASPAEQGCHYIGSCPIAIPECQREVPALRATKFADAACIRA